jgi:hypothetical protein
MAHQHFRKKRAMQLQDAASTVKPLPERNIPSLENAAAAMARK